MKFNPNQGDHKWFPATGTYRYNPKMLGEHGGEWWLVIDCDPEITRYYRKLYIAHKTGFQNLISKQDYIQEPFWAAHISVIKRDEPPNNKKYLWNKYQGQEVSFFYTHTITQWGNYFASQVVCPSANKLRQELGLPPQPWNPFHLTIGNQKNLRKS